MSQRLVVGVLGFCWRRILFFTPNYDSSFTRARVLRRSVPRARTWRPRLCLSRNEEQLCSLTVPINSYTSTRLIWLIQSIDRKRPNIFREMPHISENATKLDGFIFFVCKLVRMRNARVFWILIQFNKNMLIRRIFADWLFIVFQVKAYQRISAPRTAGISHNQNRETWFQYFGFEGVLFQIRFRISRSA